MVRPPERIVGRPLDLGAGDALGDSLYEAVIYVRGRIKSLGADAHEEPMTARDHTELREQLERAGCGADPLELPPTSSIASHYIWKCISIQEY